MLSLEFHVGRSVLAALLDQISCHGSLAADEPCCTRLLLLLLGCFDGTDLQSQTTATPEAIIETIQEMPHHAACSLPQAHSV